RRADLPRAVRGRLVVRFLPLAGTFQRTPAGFCAPLSSPLSAGQLAAGVVGLGYVSVVAIAARALSLRADARAVCGPPPPGLAARVHVAQSARGEGSGDDSFPPRERWPQRLRGTGRAGTAARAASAQSLVAHLGVGGAAARRHR